MTPFGERTEELDSARAVRAAMSMSKSHRSAGRSAQLKGSPVKKFDHRSGHVLEIDGANLYYEITGHPHAAPLVLLHGGVGTLEDFNVLIPRLERKFRIIAIDSRGHGRSTLGPLPLTYGRLQADVQQILKHLGIQRPTILGFSDGGIVAYRLAALSSLKPAKLVTIGADWELKRGDPLKKLYAKITGESWRKKFPATYETYQRLNPAPDFDRFIGALVKMWLDAGASGYPRQAVARISCDVLLVRGDEDHLVSRQTMFALAEQVKSAKLANIAFAGHVAYADRAEACMLAVNEFLAK